jgi:hypothetical protein
LEGIEKRRVLFCSERVGNALRRHNMATSIKPRAANRGKTVRVIHRESMAIATPGVQTAVITRELAAEASRARAPDRVLTFAAADATRGSRQFLIGWVPGLGSDRNATVTEAIEW